MSLEISSRVPQNGLLQKYPQKILHGLKKNPPRIHSAFSFQMLPWKLIQRFPQKLHWDSSRNSSNGYFIKSYINYSKNSIMNFLRNAAKNCFRVISKYLNRVSLWNSSGIASEILTGAFKYFSWDSFEKIPVDSPELPLRITSINLPRIIWKFNFNLFWNFLREFFGFFFRYILSKNLLLVPADLPYIRCLKKNPIYFWTNGSKTFWGISPGISLSVEILMNIFSKIAPRTPLKNRKSFKNFIKKCFGKIVRKVFQILLHKFSHGFSRKSAMDSFENCAFRDFFRYSSWNYFRNSFADYFTNSTKNSFKNIHALFRNFSRGTHSTD